MRPRTLVLMGSGEFEPWTREPERFALGRTAKPRGGGILIVPTASAAEGEDAFQGWARKGLDHYASMGIPASILPVRTREDAYFPEMVEAVAPASGAREEERSAHAQARGSG